jgi:hypothetical protein
MFHLQMLPSFHEQAFFFGPKKLCTNYGSRNNALGPLNGYIARQ